MYGNLNAPPAVAYSAIIYSLRCLVTRDIPLNQGCLAPIKVQQGDNLLVLLLRGGEGEGGVGKCVWCRVVVAAGHTLQRTWLCCTWPIERCNN